MIDRTSVGLNFRNENLGLGTNENSSTASFSYGNGSFIFGDDNDNSDSKFNNRSFVFRAKTSSSTLNSDHKIYYLVLVHYKICSRPNLSNRNVKSISNTDESSSILKENRINESERFKEEFSSMYNHVKH